MQQFYQIKNYIGTMAFIEHIYILKKFIFLFLFLLLLSVIDGNVNTPKLEFDESNLNVINYSGSLIKIYLFHKDETREMVAELENSATISILHSHENYQYLIELFRYDNVENFMFIKNKLEDFVTINHDEKNDIYELSQITRYDLVVDMIQQSISICRDNWKITHFECVIEYIAEEVIKIMVMSDRINHSTYLVTSRFHQYDKDIVVFEYDANEDKEYIYDVVHEVVTQCISSQQETDELLLGCLINEMANDIVILWKNFKDMERFRNGVSKSLHNFLCNDMNIQTSPSKYNTTKFLNNQSYNLEVLLYNKDIKLWLVKDFITEQECEAVNTYLESGIKKNEMVSPLITGTVVNYPLSEVEDTSDFLWLLHNKSLSLSNSLSGYDLSPQNGQNNLKIIQYKQGEEYFTHCDGKCDGSQFESSDIVATALLYCKVPESGGNLVFAKSDLFIQPTIGTAVFYTYRGSDGVMDDGNLEHTSCPVIQGEKVVVSLTFRDSIEGRDANTENQSESNFDEL